MIRCLCPECGMVIKVKRSKPIAYVLRRIRNGVTQYADGSRKCTENRARAFRFDSRSWARLHKASFSDDEIKVMRIVRRPEIATNEGAKR